MQSIYSILNKETKNWWYHKQLRDQGKAKEARLKERDNIKKDIDFLRQVVRCGGLLHLGNAQWSLKCNKYTTDNGSTYGSSWQGYYDLGKVTYIEEICKRLKIPIFDTRQMCPFDACSMPLTGWQQNYNDLKYLTDVIQWAEKNNFNLIKHNII